MRKPPTRCRLQEGAAGVAPGQTLHRFKSADDFMNELRLAAVGDPKQVVLNISCKIADLTARR
jgi:hypothetical protein